MISPATSVFLKGTVLYVALYNCERNIMSAADIIVFICRRVCSPCLARDYPVPGTE